MTSAAFTRWLWLAGFLVLSACATRPPVSPADSQANWLARQAVLETLTHWRVQGRIAVRTASEGWSAHFDWKQRGEDYRIRVRGPFGQGAVELHGNGLGVWLKRADQPPVFALNPEALLEQETGWQLPVAGLSSWLRGLPVPGGQTDIAWDAQGRLLQIEQNGWQISYSRYLAQGDLQLPEKLRMQRDSLQVKFIIDGWQTS
jgi:outer membrane lipoprotein LolB